MKSGKEYLFKSGFVTFVGKPNVGKSTILTKITETSFFITTPKPQTTRNSIKGILTKKDYQIIFLDTPGFLNQTNKLQEKMLFYLMEAIKSADVFVYITDISTYPSDYDKRVLEIIKKEKKPIIAIFNKIDKINRIELENKTVSLIKKWNNKKNRICFTSAKKNVGIKNIVPLIKEFLPINPPYFDKEYLSDLPEKFFVEEIIRKQIFLKLKKEIPYSSAVVVEKFDEKEKKIFIDATVFIERNSQKIIIIGKNGSMIKKIKISSEKEIFHLLKKKIKLKLWVQIKKNWKNNSYALEEVGYK